MRFILCGISVFVGAVLLAIPNLTRRELLFAVPVPSDFRKTREGRQAASTFRVIVALTMLACVCAMLLMPANLLEMTAPAAPLVILLAGAASFYWQYRKLSPAAVQFTGPREAELTDAPDRLPAFAWLSIGPFAILAAAGIWLYLNWSRIPARFPVQFDAAGQPNRWAERTVKGVYEPLLLAATFSALFILIGLAAWFGSRRSHFRPVVLGVMVGAQYLLAVIFTLVALQPALGLPAWLVAVLPIPFVLVVIAVIIKKLSEPSDPVDPTPNECWKAGVFYYNPNDAALFVEKRFGWGYTMNFANRWSWAFVAGLIAVVVATLFFI